MQKKIILSIFLIWLGFISNTAKAQSLQWAYNLNAYVNCIEIDENGNVLIAGNFGGTVDFNLSPSGVTNLISSGKLDAFFAKYTPNGNLIYARKFGSRLTDEITDAKIDNSGNIFVTGTFSDTVDFDPGVGIFQMISAPTVTQGSYSYTDIFITKFASNGSFLWAKKIGNAFDDKINSCALDSNNNIYSVGSTGGIVDFDPGPGNFSFSNLKTNQAYILKLDSNGDFVWVKQLPSNFYSYARAISISPDNMLNVTGTFRDTIVFDLATLTSPPTHINDIFVYKLNSNGVFRWLKQIGSTNSKNLRRLTTNQYGTIAMAGYLTGTCDFDPGPGIANLIAQSNDGLVCKFDSSGNYISANLIGSNSTGSLFTENCYDISFDSNSNLYVTGNFMGTADFDFGPVNYMMSADTSNLGDSYISKYDSSGNFMWAFKLSSNARDYGFRIKADNNGNLYTSGSYGGILDFNPDPNQSFTLSNPLYENFYFAKYGSAPLSIPVRLSQNELSAYPNPTSGEINIDLGDAVSAAEIIIFTLTGQEVNKLKFVNTSKLIAQLEGPNGIYILKIISDNYNSVIKLVKQ